MFNYSIGFQESCSVTMLDLALFYDIVVLFILGITFMTLGIMLSVIFNTNFVDRFFFEDYNLEYIWTLLPALMLFFLAFPSIIMLYSFSGDLGSLITIKVLGNQWFWGYSYSSLSSFSFDSYMILEGDLKLGMTRLLEVDNRLVLPINSDIHVVVSSADVIHSWSVPSLGVKMDAIPGRLNQFSFVIMKSGVYYGQCSEICGVNHSFMPIVVEGVDLSSFINWFSGGL